jgi:tRNA (guanine-N7-)-methyltransferase
MSRLREKDGLITSYGRKHARPLSERKNALMTDILPKLRVAYDEQNHQLLRMPFPDTVDTWLEIGFGGGEHLAGMATDHPEIGFIGCEPFIDGVAKLLTTIEEDSINNIALWDDDARVLMEHLPAHSIGRVFILFPDPWPKARHHKRRIINPQTLDLLARIMKQGAELLLATDHADYLTWMLEHMLADTRFKWTATQPDDWQNPPDDWIPTRYQQKAEAQGRVATFLSYKKL